SWYATEVKQQTTGYRTLWYYLKPRDITPNGIDAEKLNQAMIDFAKHCGDNDSSELPQDAVTEAVEEMTRNFAHMTDSISEMTEEIVSETVEEMANAFEELTETFAVIAEEFPLQSSMVEVVESFFKGENWQFQQLENATLHLLFQGKNSQFNCYARAREAQQQFVFYSLAPTKVPVRKRRILGEFVARANLGMIIGNFELDFNTGEIRYKTSIDVTNNVINQETLHQLVYTNVLTMDQYLLGIKSVISGQLSPEAAISQIET
ncbi:MAG: YbjN domain-containing protein, partial [Spirulinaceae cyanobacterium]